MHIRFILQAIRKVGLAVCLMTLFVPMSAIASDTPMGVIQSGTDRALQILRTSQSGKSSSLRERKAEILQIVEEYFSFQEMSRRSLGKAWKEQSPEKQKEFVKLFQQLLFNTYIDRVETYTGSNEKFVYENEKIEGDYALVKTRITGYRNADVQVEYRLRREGSKWKAYDVVIEGISLVNNYRQQFDSILAGEPFDGLLSKMREKVSEQN